MVLLKGIEPFHLSSQDSALPLSYRSIIGPPCGARIRFSALRGQRPSPGSPMGVYVDGSGRPRTSAHTAFKVAAHFPTYAFRPNVGRAYGFRSRLSILKG